MIINIRGTSGSGKTWAMRQIMEGLGKKIDHFIPGRKQPLWYQFGGIAVLGHYESTCGGCDNVGSAASVYELIKQVEPQVQHILCEGLLLSEDVKWFSQLSNLLVIFLVTDVETCITQIKQRRLDAGNEKPLNEDNTRKRVAVIERARVKLMDLDVDCRRLKASQVSASVLRKIL